ncbi:hypothetical protein GCM10009867_05260 [Pedococcus aerophilus]|uniref:Uncharacterized protein n=1 Tax=Pedococcus aerophilus TaxID=436356 RepID=A0ABP6GYU1_9MICO|nr:MULTISPECIES: hypothetical protein [unclassified Phycicoccus]KQU69692.1 hypothetical protein ASC58_20335 [Phycicoccus sp. Root101]KQZ88481.1 hypothetical protein ASD62_03280 [Phycicoccus sp. Root563]
MKTKTQALAAIAVATALAATYATTTLTSASADSNSGSDKPVHVEVFAPSEGDNAGISGAGWFVDLDVDFDGSTLAQTGFTGLQLTGPAAHNNIAPFPGTFSTGRDDRMPGLVVLTSTTNNTLPGFSGPGTNLANLFNLTGVTNRDSQGTELWDTWIVGAPIAGKNVDTTLTVAVIADLNHNGIYDDAPNVITDQNGDRRIDRRDLKAIGVASNIETVTFHLNGDPA